MLHRLIAVLLCVLGLVAAGLAVASATVWRPADTLEATATATTGTLLVTDPGVLDLAAEEVTVEASAPGAVVLVHARTEDVVAWLGEDPYTRVTGLVDREQLRTAQGPAEAPADDDAASPDPATPADGATASATDAPADEAPAGTPAEDVVLDPTGSDLWLQEVRGEGTARLELVDQPGRHSVLVASVGEDAGPPTLTLTWPQEVRTPWLVPGLAVGGALLLAGLVYLALVLRAQRRAAQVPAVPPTSRSRRRGTPTDDDAAAPTSPTGPAAPTGPTPWSTPAAPTGAPVPARPTQPAEPAASPRQPVEPAEPARPAAATPWAAQRPGPQPPPRPAQPAPARPTPPAPAPTPAAPAASPQQPATPVPPGPRVGEPLVTIPGPGAAGTESPVPLTRRQIRELERRREAEAAAARAAQAGVPPEAIRPAPAGHPVPTGSSVPTGSAQPTGPARPAAPPTPAWPTATPQRRPDAPPAPGQPGTPSPAAGQPTAPQSAAAAAWGRLSDRFQRRPRTGEVPTRGGATPAAGSPTGHGAPTGAGHVPPSGPAATPTAPPAAPPAPDATGAWPVRTTSPNATAEAWRRAWGFPTEPTGGDDGGSGPAGAAPDPDRPTRDEGGAR